MSRANTPFLDDCLASLLRDPTVREVLVVPEDVSAEDALRGHHPPSSKVRVLDTTARSGGLDAAVLMARGRWVSFVDADDTLAADSLGQLVATVRGRRGREVDVVLGLRGGDGPPRLASPWARDSPGRSRSLSQQAMSPDVVSDVALPGKLWRRATWLAAGLRVRSVHSAAPVVVRALLTASRVQLVPVLTYREENRDRSLAVGQQRRYDAQAARAAFGSLIEAAEVLRRARPSIRDEWAVVMLRDVVPPFYVDAVGGGESYFQELVPLVRCLADELGEDQLSHLPVTARMGASVVARGDWSDNAQLHGFLADHPHGLPVDDWHEPEVLLPGHLGRLLPRDVRRISAADKHLHVRLDPVRVRAGQEVRVTGAAFLDYTDDTPPSVAVVDRGERRSAAVAARPDPRVNEWAGRAFEDHTAAGFEARLPPGDRVSGALRLEIAVGGQSRTVDVPVQRAEGRDVDAVITSAQLTGSVLRIRIESPAGITRARVQGPHAFTDAATASSTGDGHWSADVVLSCRRFAEHVPLPVGRYQLELVDQSGRPVSVGWDAALLEGPPELLGDRLRVVPVAPHGGVLVRNPLGTDERGPFAQQLLESRVYAAPGSALGDVVLFESFHGRSSGDNPGAICEELLARGSELDLAWVVDDPSVTIPPGTRAVIRRSREWYSALAGARAYVGNAAAPRFFRKREGQVHVQTWHGTPLKRIGEDRGPGDLNTWRHRRMLAGQSARWDVMLSPSSYCTDIFRSAFGFEGEVLEIGSPRNDVLLSDHRDVLRHMVRDQLGLSPADRVVLYAPTWREYLGRRVGKPLYLDAAQVTAAVGDTVVLIRGHYNATREGEVFRDHDRILDVTRYPDIAMLYLAADVLVTDYSSVMFDFALTDRPILLLVPDLEQYRDVERGFYFDIEADAPGPLLRSTEAVVSALGAPDRHQDARAAFRRRFGPYEDGKASARVVDRLLDG